MNHARAHEGSPCIFVAMVAPIKGGAWLISRMVDSTAGADHVGHAGKENKTQGSHN
jgi:hypothetical protein